MNRRSFLFLLAMLSAGASHAKPRRAHRLADAAPSGQESLIHAIRQSIARLGQVDGYFGVPGIRIGLHKNLARAEGLLRSFGLGTKIDDLVLASNRTAEVAIREAESMLTEQFAGLISSNDTAPPLTADVDAMTVWLRDRADIQLNEKLLPFVHNAAGRTDLERAYQALYRSLQRLTNGESNQATVEKYITRQALDGLYKTIAFESHRLQTSSAKLTGRYAGSAAQA